MRTERLTFDNGRGDELAARLDRPLHGQARGAVLFAHCFTCSKNLGAVVAFSRALVARGWMVLRFDFTGLGDSDGSFENTNFSSNVDDLVAAAHWLETNHEAPGVLVGHSLGGAAVLRAAAHLPSVLAVATIGAPAHPEHVAGLLKSSRETIERDGRAEVELGGRRFTIKKEFLDDIAEQPMREAIAALKRALLVVHAPQDQIVGIDNASRIFGAARHPKSFVSLDGADHLMSKPSDAQFAATMVAAWADRYMPEDAAPPASTGEHVVAWGPEKGFTTAITGGPNVIVADEPKTVGGTELGPTPYGLLQAALGACTVMTLRMYADRKRWPLRQAVARMSHDKVHAKDCEACPKSDASRLDRIERTLELHGEDLTQEQRARLLEIADKCPVHRTLVDGPIAVITKLV